MIPTTFEEWYDCITRRCAIQMTKEFAKERLGVYMDSSHYETKKFIQLYGEQHLENVINWYKRI